MITLLLFLGFSIWWIFIRFVLEAEGSADLNNTRFTVTYGLMALVGGVNGLFISRKWGGSKSVLGRAILMFSLGLLAQEFGQLAYTYYIYFQDTAVPYPSLGDVGYFGSVLLYIYGIILLAKAAGAKFSLGSIGSKLKVLVIPLILLITSYAVFLRGYEFDWSAPITVLLDFGYPLGQAIYISIALLAYLLSRRLLGGVMKNKILFIMFALLVQYIADFTFLYQVQQETWYAGGWNDYIYLVSYFIMAVALLKLKTTYNQIKE